MSDLVNDFIEKAEETKEIPMENGKSMFLVLPGTFEPTNGELSQASVDMSWLDTMAPAERDSLYTNMMNDKFTILSMLTDLSNMGEAAVEKIMNSITDHATSLDVKMEHDNLDAVGNTYAILIDVLMYVTECISYIEMHYDVNIVEKDFMNGIMSADDVDVEDDNIASMLATELSGGTDGVEFTNEELYGGKKQ